MAKTSEVSIKPIEIRTTEITIEGDSPLIMHAWSEKAKLMMLESQQGKAKGKTKKYRNPVAEFIESMYWLTGKPIYADDATEEECEEAFNAAIAAGAKFGFPCTAIKQAANAAAYRMGWVKNQAGLRGAYFLSSSFGDMVEIKSETPIMREDMVRIGMGSADLRYRGEFRNWTATFNIAYNVAGEFSLENLINIINAGGTVCGIGEWRPEKDGDFGRFHVKAN
jgi:hypothetical protein